MSSSTPATVVASNKTLVAVTILAALVLVGAVTTCIVISRTYAPQDGAIFATAVIASSAASVNIILSYFVLFTTQKQLSAIRANSQAERRETAEQLRLTKEQLDEARTQTQHAQEENERARELARESNRESLRARLDVLAPRVTMRRAGAILRYHSNRDDPSYVEQLPEINELENSTTGSLVFELRFLIENWGDEPVTLTLPDPWSESLGYYYVLEPGKQLFVTRDFPVYLHADGLRRFAREGWARPDNENPWHYSITITAANTSFNVQDTLHWSGSMQPFSLNEYGKVIRVSDLVVNDVPVAHKTRSYSTEQVEGQ